MEKEAAISLAKEFQQNAIYYVNKNELQLVPCLLPYPELCLGSFSERVRLVNELPDSYC